MLSFTLVILAQIGNPQSIHLLDDSPLLAQVAAPPLLPSSPPATEGQVSARQLQADLDALKRQRPGLGGSITLLAIGGGATVVGALYLLLSTSVGLAFGGGLNPFLLIGALGLGVGVPLLVIGVWLLYNRLEDRRRIDQESKSLRQQLQQIQPSDPRYAPPGNDDFPPPQVRGPDASMLLARFD